MNQLIPTFPLFLLLIHVTTILAQAPALAPAQQGALAPTQPRALAPAPPAALAPAPPGPTNITAILEKAGRFTTLIHLLQSTQSADRINTEIAKSRQGLTIFAPPDSAFSNLKSGSLNSYTDQQKAELLQFHIIPSFMGITQFQTASNPLSTEAGGTDYGQFPINVTTSGNFVNITTGFANASVVNTVYTDNMLAVYEVNKVLLPEKFFVPPPPPPPPAPAPAPALSKHKKGAQSTDLSAGSANSSDAVRLIHDMFQAIICLVAVLASTWLFG